MNLALRPVQNAALAVARSQNRSANLTDYKREARRYLMRLNETFGGEDAERLANAAFSSLYDESGTKSVKCIPILQK